METRIQHPYVGGIIEESPEGKMTVLDEVTQQPKELELQDRITVTYGKKKATLNGPMVQALHELYSNNGGFRDWCSRCR